MLNSSWDLTNETTWEQLPQPKKKQKKKPTLTHFVSIIFFLKKLVFLFFQIFF